VFTAIALYVTNVLSPATNKARLGRDKAMQWLFWRSGTIALSFISPIGCSGLA
jgi:hypothetical protein